VLAIMEGKGLMRGESRDLENILESADYDEEDEGTISEPALLAELQELNLRTITWDW
jgi:hypothetical protein